MNQIINTSDNPLIWAKDKIHMQIYRNNSAAHVIIFNGMKLRVRFHSSTYRYAIGNWM